MEAACALLRHDPGEVAEAEYGGHGEHHGGDVVELNGVVAVRLGVEPGVGEVGVVSRDDADEDEGVSHTSGDNREHRYNNNSR